MLARSVSMRLKASVGQFTQTIGQDALPLFRKQKASRTKFRSSLPLEPRRLQLACGRKENADAYSRDAYPGLLKSLGKVVEGTPQVHTYEVVNSPSH
jgi:hypothetical protein